MRLPVFALLRWVQQHPKAMRVIDLLIGLISLAIGLWQNSSIWIIISLIFIMAAVFRLGERMNLFLPKIKPPKQETDA
jgi:hypothetical protein